MAMTPSVGDILMLSQTAWKVARAFTQGQKSAPAEFAEIEREANGLSDALKLVAETLHSDGSTLERADDNTKSAVSTIIDSAQRTLSDLESFVERYRILRKEQTSNGFTSERRTWSEVVLANYKTLAWTTEGGSISALRDMLHIHTSTINLTMQALQSKSLSRLEKVVMPMSEHVASIHDRVNGDLGEKIDDLHRVIMTVVNGTPALSGCGMHERLNSTASTVSTIDMTNNSPRLVDAANAGANQYFPTRPLHQITTHCSSFPDQSPVLSTQWRENHLPYGSPLIYSENGNNAIDLDFESGAPPIHRLSIGDRYAGSANTTAVATPESFVLRSETQRRRMSNTPRRESTTIPSPSMFQHDDDEDAQGGNRQENNSPYASPKSLAEKRRVDSKADNHELPPPALSPRNTLNGELPPLPATPTSIFTFSQRRSDSSRMAQSPRIPTGFSSSSQGSKSPSVRSSHRIGQPSATSGTPVFEKSLFRNSAILCDVRCTSIEYAKRDPDAIDPRFDTEMVTACESARVYVIRKRENRENVGTKVVTSIWALSDDGEVRCQQKLPEYTDTVPYCSFFEPEKVAIAPADGETILRFHAHDWGDREQKDVKTNWINYKFETEKHANEFQSAVFGRQLLGSFRTTKTTVLHEGFKGAFALEEQFANIEVLRLWEDDGVNTRDASGGVMALLHMGGNFGQGWAKWWMNSSRQQVRVKDESNRFAKLKGIDIRVLRPVEKSSGSGGGNRAPPLLPPGETQRGQAFDVKGKKGLERNVTGVKIEFKNDTERARFVELVRRVQERVLPLPDI
ncbi:hypothetical protein Q7P37_010097 [Cladosporium fusiforme]